MDIDFYVHIGAGKTGTSAIQAFFNNNRKILFSDHSCLYPNTNATDGNYAKGHCRNHVEFFKNNDESEMIEKIRKIITFSRQHRVQKIVFSWEGLFDRHRFARVIADALAGSDDIRPHIIVYLRRQDHWLESAWKQWFAIKKGYRDFNHFVDTYTIRWDEYLGVWSGVFGREQIIVQPYESVQLQDGLIVNFLKKLGIEYQGNFWVEVEKQDYNLGFDEDIIEILHQNRDFYPDGDNSSLQNFLHKNLHNEYKKKPFDRYSLFSPEKRMEIFHQYEPMNRYIAQNFLHRADGRLFFEPWPSAGEIWERPEGMTVKKLVPILSYVLYSMNTKTEEPAIPVLKKIKTNADYYLWRTTKNRIFCFFKKV